MTSRAAARQAGGIAGSLQHERAVADGPLQVADVDHRHLALIQAVVLDVVDDADDLLHAVHVPVERGAVSERGLARAEVAASEAVAHDHHRWHAVGVAVVERAPGEHADAERAEVLRADDALLGHRLLAV